MKDVGQHRVTISRQSSKCGLRLCPAQQALPTAQILVSQDFSPDYGHDSLEKRLMLEFTVLGNKEGPVE